MNRLEKEIKDKKYFNVAMFYEIKDWLANNEEDMADDDVWNIVDKMNNDQQLNEEIIGCIEYYFEEVE